VRLRRAILSASSPAAASTAATAPWAFAFVAIAARWSFTALTTASRTGAFTILFTTALAASPPSPTTTTAPATAVAIAFFAVCRRRVTASASA
jgi:hypothetical protein